MKNITLIAAIGKNNELGKDNNLLWRIKEDLKFFKENTIGKTILMGSKTFYSLPGLLPNRKHVVLTKQDLKIDPSVVILRSVEEALQYIESLNEEVMIIGGGQIYKEFIDYSNKLLITEIDDEKEADTFFPLIKKQVWKKEILSEHEENNIKYKHILYTRKN